VEIKLRSPAPLTVRVGSSAMPLNVGPLEVVIVLVVIFAIFGAKRVPQMARSAGSGIREFRSSLSIDTDNRLPRPQP
jgi:sec-independent protein translocase protein TatA